MTTSSVAAESALTPSASRYLDEIEAIKRDATALASELTDDQANWRPAPARWSIAQCIAHIAVSGRAYLGGIDAAIAEAKRRAAAGLPAYRQGILANWLARSMEPPPGFRMRTFRSLEPPERLPVQAILTELIGLHDDYAQRIRQAGGLDLDGGRMRSPFVRFIRLTADQALRVHLAHARRHLWQAWRIRKGPRFPA